MPYSSRTQPALSVSKPGALGLGGFAVHLGKGGKHVEKKDPGLRRCSAPPICAELPYLLNPVTCLGYKDRSTYCSQLIAFMYAWNLIYAGKGEGSHENTG